MNLILVLEIMYVHYRRKVKQFLYACLLPLFLFGCQGARYLKENEKLLHRQTIKGPKGFDTAPMANLYTQEANRKLLGQLPINTLVWLYYIGYHSFNNPNSHSVFKSKAKLEKARAKKEKRFDKKISSASDPRKISSLQFRKQQKINSLVSKIEKGNMAMQWGEPVAVFDTAQVTATVHRMNSYLFNKGYFLGNTSVRYTEFKKRISVFYEVQPSVPYLYDTLLFDIADSAVFALIKKSEQKSLIKRGEHYDQDKLGQERERIDLLLKDNGYYDFSRQYVDFQVDTTFNGPHRVALLLSIENPARRNNHKRFFVDSVTMTPDASLKSNRRRITKDYHGLTFSYLNDYFSERILSQRIFIKKDSLYSRTNTFNTQRQLANLDNFKFVNVNYDTSGGRFIANIFASPLDRYSWTNEAGVTVTQGFPGPYYSLSFKKRNIFRGLENFELNGRFGFEGVASATSANNIYKSTEANGSASIIFPQFLFPLRAKTSNRWGRYNPKTRLSSGYTYTNRPEYQRSAVNVSGIYTWEKKRTSYSFTAGNLNIIRSRVDSAFSSALDTLQLKQGNNLKNSFKPSLVSSMIFSILWNPNNYGNLEKSSLFLRATFESGGTFFNFFEPKIATNQGLAFYKYLRVNLDIRRNEVINKNTVIAYRVNTGVAYSYSANKTLPYEKFFFVGGSNSVRAWRPRRLGVGSTPPTLSATPKTDGLFDYQFEKPGEILMEGSLEVRQKFFGFVNLAAFIDAGNVWSFRQSPSPTPGENVATWTGDTKFYAKEFYKQFGVGTGFGFRFDFSFLVLRLDVGLKVYDPGRQPGDRFVLDNIRFFKPYGIHKEPAIYNVGIGYPF
jgi:outer membrane protein insertion porin family